MLRRSLLLPRRMFPRPRNLRPPQHPTRAADRLPLTAPRLRVMARQPAEQARAMVPPPAIRMGQRPRRGEATVLLPAARTVEPPRRMPMEPPQQAPTARQPEEQPVPEAEERVQVRAAEPERAIPHRQEAMKRTPPTAARSAPAPTASAATFTMPSAAWISITD